MKKQVIPTLLAVLALSILPGCGKSKNEGGVIVGGGGVVVPPGYPTAYVFSGSGTIQMSNATGAIAGTLNQGSASVGGTLYTRSNGIDRVDLYIAGSASMPTGYTNVPATINVYLGQSTVDAFQYYCGAQPVLAEIGSLPNNVYVPLTAGSPGTISMSIKLWAQMPNGQWCSGVI